jgi:hypothetical protein
MGRFWPTASRARPNSATKLAHGMASGCTRRVRSRRGGVLAHSAAAVGRWQGVPLKHQGGSGVALGNKEGDGTHRTIGATTWWWKNGDFPASAAAPVVVGGGEGSLQHQ